jgi:ligand-binding sensor domain-containing protein/two-component sensor histidine kinase
VPSVTFAERLPVKTYTTTDGLARDAITRIVQDERGFLWFCTSNGLSRFDGYRFTNYSVEDGLTHQITNDLLETGAGVYWVAASRGLCRLNTRGDAPSAGEGLTLRQQSRNQRFTPYFFSDGTARVANVLLEDSAGRVWVGTDNGLFRLEETGDKVSLRRIDIGLASQASDETEVLAIAEDRQGAIWIGMGNDGLYRLGHDGRIDHYTTRDGLPGIYLRSLLLDRQGRMWAGLVGGLCLLVSNPQPGGPVVARVFTSADGLAHNSIWDVKQTLDGRIWISTVGGLSVLDGERVQSYTTANGLASNSLKQMLGDRDGNLWVGTEGSGVMKLTGHGFASFAEPDGIAASRIWSIFEDHGGRVCVITGSATLGGAFFINQLNGGVFTSVRPAVPARISHPGWGTHQITFQDHSGAWWVPTAEGLCRFPDVDAIEQLSRVRPRAVYTSADGLPGNVIFRIFEDSHGDIWVGAIFPPESGLARWDRATGKFRRYLESDGLPASHTPASFCEDRFGNIWIGFFEGGIARYRNGRFTVFGAADGLPPGFVEQIYMDRSGQIWLAANGGGAIRVDEAQSDHPSFTGFTKSDGLASNVAHCITGDEWGRIYIGNDHGLDRLDPDTGRIKHYTTADGLAGNDVLVSFCDRTGRLWFGTTNGLSCLMPEQDRVQPPPVYIGGLSVRGVAYRISELGQTELSGLDLGPDQNQLQVDLLSPAFALGETISFQYKLEGADLDWGPADLQRSVNYASLAPGSYRFRVRAVGSDGMVSDVPATIGFRILPPVWRRWWFVTPAAVLAAVLLYSGYRFRVSRLVEIERVRTRIAADLHDDIGSSLSQIAVLSEVLRKQMPQDNPRLSKTLSAIARGSLSAVDSMSDIVWAVDPHKDHLLNLSQRMRRLASEVLPASNIELHFIAPPAEHDVRLGANVRREVFLIFKESLNNIVRHSGCARAEIELRVDRSRLFLRLSDDGKGFDPNSAGDGNGLRSMRRRAAALNGELELDTDNRSGTTIRLDIPRG